MAGTETYDLTYSDNDENWITFKDPTEGQGEAHFVCVEDLVEVRGPTGRDATKFTLFARSLEKMEQW